MDRIDLRVFVEHDYDESGATEERKELVTTEEIRVGIAKAVKTQRERQGIRNARLSPQEILDNCALDTQGRKVLDDATLRYGFSPRAISSCLKVSRTIADLAGEPHIQPHHVQEAVDLRKLCTTLVPEL